MNTVPMETVSNERLKELSEWTLRADNGVLSCARDEWKKMARELIALREANRWIPVSEILPEWGDFVLVIVNNAVEILDPPCTIGWIDEHGRWQGELTMLNVTHWRPLPPAPERE
jgi:hypothetical protein